MNEEQLILGPIERMEAQVPSVRPEDVEEEAQGEQGVPKEVMPTLAFERSTERLSPFDTAPLDPLQRLERDTMPPSNGLVEEATDIFNLANAGSGMPLITPDAVLQALTSERPIEAVQSVITGIEAEDAEVRKAALMDIIGDPIQNVEARLAQAKKLSEDTGFDANLVQRQALHNINMVQGHQNDTPDGEAAFEAASDYIEGMSKDVEPILDTDVAPDEYRRAYTSLLNFYVQDTEDEIGWNWRSARGLATSALVPFRYQAPVVEIYRDLKVGDKFGPATNAKGVFLMGEGLANIRTYIDELPDDRAKLEALQTIMRVLKPNAGVLASGNDWVSTHILQQVFQKDLGLSKEGEGSPEMVKAGMTAAPLAPALGLTVAAAGAAPVAVSNLLTRGVDNAGSVLDAIGVGALARATIKFGTKFLPNTVRRLNHVAPDVAAKQMVDALTDPRLRERVQDMEPEEIVETFMPSASAAMQEGGVNGLAELLARNLDIRERAMAISGKSNMTAAERAMAMREMETEFGEIAARDSSTLHLDKTVYADKAQAEMEISAVFGRDKHNGWASLGNARKARKDQIEELFGKDADVRIVAKHPQTGKLVEVGDGVPNRQVGEFYLQAKDVRQYDAAPTTFHELMFQPNDVANLTFSPGRWGRNFSLGFTNPGNLFSKNLLDAMSYTKTQQTRWQSLSLDLTKDIHALNAGQQAKLSSVMKEGEKIKTSTGRGTTYSPSQLYAKGLDEPTVNAYYQARTSLDIMYDVANRQTRTQMFRQGMKDIQGPQGRIGFGKPQREQDAIASIRNSDGRKDLDVFDPATGEFHRYSADDIAALYKDGSSIAAMRTPIVTRTGEAAHVLVDSKAGSKALGLPRQVVTRVEGYYPHMWEGNFVVYGRTKQGNRVAMGLAKNEADAAAARDKLMGTLATRAAKGKASKWEEFGYDLDRSLTDIGHRGAVMEDMYVNMGGPIYGQRSGGKLRNFSKSEGDILLDPIESLLRGMEVIGQSVTKGELANTMRQKLFNFVRTEGLETIDPRRLPDAVTNPIKPNQGKKAAYDKAQAYAEQIEFYQRTPDAVDQFMSRFFLGASGLIQRIAEKVPGAAKLTKPVGQAAANLAVNPKPLRVDAALMGFMHRFAISAAPVRHHALGWGQSLLMAGVSPTNYAKSIGQVTGVMHLLGMEALRSGKIGMMNAKQVDAWYKNAAKIVPGMDAQELRQVVNTMFESGITSAVAHNSQMRASMRSLAFDRMRASGSKVRMSPVGQVGATLRAGDAATFGWMSKIGFEAGEDANRIITFLTLYNRDRAAGKAKLGDADYVKSLVGNVNEFTGNMVPELGYGFQRGWFKNATQFWSFQLKMGQLMLPEFLGGSRTITKADKVRLMFGQALLFGRRGAAQFDALYRVIEMKMAEVEAEDEHSALVEAWESPVTQALMQGFLIDWTANQALKMLGGPDTPDFAISDGFAPGGGTDFVVDALLDLGSLDVQTMAGLSGERASKLISYMNKAKNITLAQVKGLDDVPFDERAEELAKQGAAELFSTYNRVLAVKAAAKMDGFVSAGGTVTEGFSGPLEDALYRHFGVMTKDRASLYEAMDKFSEDYRDNPRKHLDELSDQYYKDFIAYATKLDGETSNRQEVYDNMLDQWTRQRGYLFSALEPHEAEYVSEHVRDRLSKAITNRDSAEYRVVERITKDVRDHHFGEEGPKVLKYLEDQAFVKDNPRLVEIIDRAFREATTTDEGE